MLAIVPRRPSTTPSSACCRSSTRSRRWRTCCCRSRSARASSFSRPSARRRCSRRCESRGITIFACVPQFFYLIHQRVTAEVGAAAARSRARCSARSSPPTSGCAITLGWNPGTRVFARVHRALGPTMRVLVTGGSTLRSGHRPRSLRPGLHAAQRLRPDRDVRRRDDRPARRSLHDVGRPAAAGRGDQDRDTSRRDVRSTSEPTQPTIADGEILIRGPIVMREYFNRPDATAEALAGRLAAHRRPRPPRRRRPALHHRPQEGDHRPQLRQESLSGGDRSALPAVAVHQGAVRARPDAGRASRRPSGCTR